MTALNRCILRALFVGVSTFVVLPYNFLVVALFIPETQDIQVTFSLSFLSSLFNCRLFSIFSIATFPRSFQSSLPRDRLVRRDHQILKRMMINLHVLDPRWSTSQIDRNPTPLIHIRPSNSQSIKNSRTRHSPENNMLGIQKGSLIQSYEELIPEQCLLRRLFGTDITPILSIVQRKCHCHLPPMIEPYPRIQLELLPIPPQPTIATQSQFGRDGRAPLQIPLHVFHGIPRHGLVPRQTRLNQEIVEAAMPYHVGEVAIEAELEECAAGGGAFFAEELDVDGAVGGFEN
mmetsp:Transcript_7839/g.16862  ORF Transcript_7839/g.16862 Transcript_7839/m.16862 type:complete len:289 (+) Transcript_7839:1025-1891(+)